MDFSDIYPDFPDAHIPINKRVNRKRQMVTPQENNTEMADKNTPDATSANASPSITHFAWGEVKVEGSNTMFKDVQLYPGGVQLWDWSLTGTRHIPGIQPEDTIPVVEAGARIVILSKGVHERLQVMPETIAFLEEKGITVEVLQSEAAVERYNVLCKTEAVGLLLHSTC